MSWRDFSPDTKGLTPVHGAAGEWRHAKGQSTVAYDPPQRRGRCIAKDHTCKAFAMKDGRYCVGHARAFGLLKEHDVDAG